MSNFVQIPVKTWFLEYPQNKSIPQPRKGVTVDEWDMPEVKDYLEMYTNVGEKYGWSQRLLMEKAQLISLLKKNSVSIFLYFIDGVNAGYFEIDFSVSNKAEIVYLGLTPDYIGKGYGKSIMYEAIRKASEGGKNLVWLHTCEFDHYKALDTYMKAGFELVKEELRYDYYPDNHPAVRSKQ